MQETHKAFDHVTSENDVITGHHSTGWVISNFKIEVSDKIFNLDFGLAVFIPFSCTTYLFTSNFLIPNSINLK